MTLRERRAKNKKRPALTKIEDLEADVSLEAKEEEPEEELDEEVEEKHDPLEDRLEKKLQAVKDEIDEKTDAFNKYTSDMQKGWNKSKTAHDKEINVLETKAVEIQGALKLVRGDL